MKRGGSLDVDLLGVTEPLPIPIASVDWGVRSLASVDSKVLVGMTVVTGDMKSKSSSLSSSPLAYCISLSQLKLYTASGPHPTGRKPSVCFSWKGSPQLSAEGFSSLNVKTAESGMMQADTFKQ